jgi:ribosomal protein S12 methylthiotransferase
LIPSLKGAFRSRKPEDIISEAKVLISKGIKEIILVAQDCGCYPNLPKLLKNLSRIPGDFWIRVLYIYPERITDELIKTIKNSPKICHYLDIPLQHGDPKILHSMRRQSNIAETLKKISKIRKIIPDIALRTSIITGFPGEDKKAFENLKKFIKKISFDHVGVFEYSREKGTPAYDFPNQISDKEKRRRKKILMLLQQKISLNKNKSLLGKTTKVLIENYDAKAGFYIARSQKFAPEIDGVIFVKSKVPLQKSSFITTKITKTLPYDLISETF